MRHILFFNNLSLCCCSPHSDLPVVGDTPSSGMTLCVGSHYKSQWHLNNTFMLLVAGGTNAEIFLLSHSSQTEALSLRSLWCDFSRTSLPVSVPSPQPKTQHRWCVCFSFHQKPVLLFPFIYPHCGHREWGYVPYATQSPESPHPPPSPQRVVPTVTQPAQHGSRHTLKPIWWD